MSYSSAAVALAVWLSASGTTGLAASFTDNFANGINPTNWFALTNTPRFSVVPENGVAQIQSTTGTNNGFFWGTLFSEVTAYGDFDVSIDFTNASLAWRTGSPGNQAQLNCYFGDFYSITNFFVVRSDEATWDQNAHIWMGNFPPDGAKLGPALSTNISYGTLRITRTNSLVSGYINSTLIAQTNFVTVPAHFQLVLQNNGTEDAISIGYNNFQLTADKITVGPPLSIRTDGHGDMVLSWPTWGVGWTTNYALESTAGPLESNPWQTVSPAPLTNGENLVVTNAPSNSSGFYRLHWQ